MQRKITRRSFVVKSAALIGGVALTAGAARSVSPNDKIGIAIVGAGRGLTKPTSLDGGWGSIAIL